MQTTGDKLKAILIEVGGDDTMSYGLGMIIEAMRRAYLMGRDDANADAEAAETN